MILTKTRGRYLNEASSCIENHRISIENHYVSMGDHRVPMKNQIVFKESPPAYQPRDPAHPLHDHHPEEISTPAHISVHSNTASKEIPAILLAPLAQETAGFEEKRSNI